MKLKKKQIKKLLGIVGITVGTVFIGMNILAGKKKGNSVYENEPEEKNPLEGKKVIFIADENDKENADGVRGHLEAIGLSEHHPGIYEKYIKRTLDLVLSFGGLVVLSPLYTAISLAIVIDDPGPVLFIQKRMGENKKYFKLHKFRSMKMSTPHDVPTHMLENPEQYITKVGKFLRAHSLDELPQIWDIFIGNMSIIGPRPGLWNQDVLTAERDKYGANDVKPGLTGWAQINGRDELEIPEKAKLDGYYVQNMGFKMDVLSNKCIASDNFNWKNDGRTKVMIGCGTRPEIIRLAAVIKRCREYFDCCVVYYNQNWDRNLSTVFWEDFELTNTFGEFGPDILVPVVGENLGVTCGNILGRSYELLSELQPDGYLVLGDTNSCLSAISAKRLHIPLFHMEAGNRCKDECLPEETNRRIVDVISDVNLCYSEFARKYLADTGLPKERTYMTGSPMAEVLRMNLEKIQKSDVLERLGLEKDKYILLSAHREENIDSEKNFLSLFTAINALAEKYDMPILYSCHPRSKNRLEKSGFRLDPRVRVNEPLGFNDYNKLQMNALAIVSDSGTLPEESSFYLSIGHPIAAVCIRTSTERPEALEAGDFILAGITTKELLNATDMAIAMKKNGVLGKPCPDYVDETVSMKVVRIIQGYVNVVNKMVWRKDQ